MIKSVPTIRPPSVSKGPPRSISSWCCSAYARLPLTRPKYSESESGSRVRFRTSFETTKTQFTGQEKAQNNSRTDTFDRHKYHFCSKWRLLSPYQSSSDAVAPAKGATPLCHGRFLPIVCDGSPLRALRTRDAGYFGATGIVLSAGRSDSSTAPGDRFKRIAY